MVLVVLTNFISADNAANFRSRRFLIQNHYRHGGPYGIRMPYPKIIPGKPLFAHSVAWKAKRGEPTKSIEQQQQDHPEQQQHNAQQQDQQQPEQDVEVTQFHSQDANGHVIFGFNSPDQMRIETRNPDGTVHGTYSYVDAYGRVIKRQYWDTGSGFHVTSNSYSLTDGVDTNNNQNAPSNLEQQYTPEVQAARDLHFQLYEQALSSHLTSPKGPKNSSETAPNVIETEAKSTSEANIKSVVNSIANLINGTNFGNPSNTYTNNNINNTSDKNSSYSLNTTHSSNFSNNETSTVPADFGLDSKHNYNNDKFLSENEDTFQDIRTGVEDDDVSINEALTKDHNGTIIIQNPEYLRISWITDSKIHEARHRNNKYRSDISDTLVNGYLNTNRRSRFVSARKPKRGKRGHHTAKFL